jgi:Fe-S-cluster containining protein
MIFPDLFEEYKMLVRKADNVFKKMREDYGGLIPCRMHCYDCCYAIFGLFLIEAIYLNYHFNSLKRKEKRGALLRAEKADTKLLQIKDKISLFDDDEEMKVYGLGRQRLRCPLLSDQKECILYEHRPITCRLYGIPVSIDGKASVCGKTGFTKDVTYTTFDLNKVYKELYMLSKDLLEGARSPYLENASLLISVSKAIRTPIENLIKEDFRD